MHVCSYTGFCLRLYGVIRLLDESLWMLQVYPGNICCHRLANNFHNQTDRSIFMLNIAVPMTVYTAICNHGDRA